MALFGKKTSTKNKTIVKEQSSSNKAELIESEKIYQKGLATVKDIIAPAAFKIESDCVTINKKFASTVFAYAYPRFLQSFQNSLLDAIFRWFEPNYSPLIIW